MLLCIHEWSSGETDHTTAMAGAAKQQTHHSYLDCLSSEGLGLSKYESSKFAIHKNTREPIKDQDFTY